MGEGLGGVRVWETGFVCIREVGSWLWRELTLCVSHTSQPPLGGGGEGPLSSLSLSLSLVCVYVVCLWVSVSMSREGVSE